VILAQNIYLVGSGEPDLAQTDSLDCQVYLIKAGRSLALIDAGAGNSVDLIISNIISQGLNPEDIKWLFLTHTHADHAGGVAGLKSRLPNLRVAVSAESADWLRNGDEQAISVQKAREKGAFYPIDYHFRGCDVDIELVGDTNEDLGDFRIEVISSPGHCNGHLSYLFETGGKRALFSGDAIFPEGKILLQDIWDCDLHESLRSIEKLAELHADHLLAGHGHPVLDHASDHFHMATDRISCLLIPHNLL
jgi:hydroxyacylglutathione hydrolase